MVGPEEASEAAYLVLDDHVVTLSMMRIFFDGGVSRRIRRKRVCSIMAITDVTPQVLRMATVFRLDVSESMRSALLYARSRRFSWKEISLIAGVLRTVLP